MTPEEFENALDQEISKLVRLRDRIQKIRDINADDPMPAAYLSAVKVRVQGAVTTIAANLDALVLN